MGDRGFPRRSRPEAGRRKHRLRNPHRAGSAFASELIHLRVLPGEITNSPLRGLFLVLAAAGKGLLAVSLLFGPGKWAVRFGILLNIVVVVLRVITRFVSVPAFPPLLGFTRLPVGMLDLAATTVEIARLSRRLPPKKRERRVRCAHA